jgi:hypothetical protein
MSAYELFLKLVLSGIAAGYVVVGLILFRLIWK